MRRIHLVIAEERTLFRQGLAALLNAAPDFLVVGEADSVEEARSVCRRAPADLILLGAALPDASREDRLAALLSDLRADCPQTAIVVLGEDAAAPDAEEATRTAALQAQRQCALSLGACAFLPTSVDQKEFLRVLRAVSICALTPESPALKADTTLDLTPRERAIIALIAKGKYNKEIAGDLGIKIQTVKNHVSHLLEKLEFNDRTQLAVYAIEHHLVEP